MSTAPTKLKLFHGTTTQLLFYTLEIVFMVMMEVMMMIDLDLGRQLGNCVSSFLHSILTYSFLFVTVTHVDYGTLFSIIRRQVKQRGMVSQIKREILDG